MEYVGFKHRLYAKLIDGLFLLPLTIIGINTMTKSLLSYQLNLLLMLLGTFVINFLILGWYSGSPGKLILNIRVVKKNGEPIKWKEVILRNLIDYTLLIITNMIIIIILNNSIIDWANVKLVDIGKILEGILEYNLARILTSIWVIANTIVFFYNKEKRAIHDLIAGTVVVYKQKN